MATSNVTEAPKQNSTREPAQLASLLRRERKRFSTYYTLLQEMGIRGELPEWVRNGFPSAGRHDDWDAQDADQAQTDRVIKGGYVQTKYCFGLDTKGNAFVHDNQTGALVYEGKPSALPTAHAEALFEFTPSQLRMYAMALRLETLGDDHDGR